MERYEFVGGSSEKFWEAKVKGNALNVHWGRIGTKGQEQTKTFTSTILAHGAMRKLVSEKLGKGYKPVSSGVQMPTSGVKSRKELKALIKLWRQYQPENYSFISPESKEDKTERSKIREEKSAAAAAILKLIQEHPRSLTMSDLSTFLVGTSVTSDIYRAALNQILKTDLDENEVVKVINEVARAQVKNEDIAAIFKNFLERRRPTMGLLEKIIWRLPVSHSHYATSFQGLAQHLYKAVRVYLPPQEYRELRKKLDPDYSR